MGTQHLEPLCSLPGLEEPPVGGRHCSNSPGASSQISMIVMAFFFFFSHKHRSAAMHCTSKLLVKSPHGTSSPGYLTAQHLAEGGST